MRKTHNFESEEYLQEFVTNYDEYCSDNNRIPAMMGFAEFIDCDFDLFREKYGEYLSSDILKMINELRETYCMKLLQQNYNYGEEEEQ